MERYGKIPARVAEKWTPTAIDCYKLGCNCSKCHINMIMETQCYMKAVVVELVKKLGRPTARKYRDNFIKE